MKHIIVFFTISLASLFASAKDENYTQLAGNKFANGDTVVLKEVTVNNKGKKSYYSGCLGLIYGSKSESNLWKMNKELDVERQYYMQINCNTQSIYHQWIQEDQIAKLIKRKQTTLPENNG